MKSSSTFNIRAFAALITGAVFLVMMLSGIALYVAPPGRIAFTTGWHLLLLDKGQWQAVHIVTGVLFIAITIWHLSFSWKPFKSYLRVRVNGRLIPRRELGAALLLAVVIIAGTLTRVPPFQQILDLGDLLSLSWGGAPENAPWHGRGGQGRGN